MPHQVVNNLNSTNQIHQKKTENLVEFQDYLQLQFLHFEPNSPFIWWLNEGQIRLPPEVERDNIEYKVKNLIVIVWLNLKMSLYVYFFK